MLAILLCLLPIAAAHPFAASATPGLDALDASSRREALVARFDAHFADDHAEASGCLTGLVADLKANWDIFSTEERARMTAALSPWKTDLLEAQPATPPAPPAAAAEDSCFGQQMDNRLTGEHFVVEWDDGTPDAYADAFLEALEASYQVEVVELEWRAPLGDGRYLMPAYIERGNSQGAYTTVAECGRSYVPYMVAYSGSWADASWADTMAAHEFNHALQFGYGWALEFWFWEATATYVEDSVFESDWWTWYVSGYSVNPHIAMGASSQDDQDIFWHMYGMAIWVRYLHEYQGGLDTVKQIWELGSEQRTNGYNYTQEEALTEAGVDFQAAYLDFIARTSVMDYEDHRALSAYASVAMSDTIDSLPAEGESESRTEPEGYGQNFYTFDAGMGDGTLRVTFEGEDAVEWGIVLAENDGRAVTRSVSVVTEGGVGTLDLTGYGDEEVVLVVSPLTDADRGRSYTWSAELVAEAAEGDDTGTDDDGLSDGGEDVKLGGSCGCASSTAAGSGWVAAGALALVLARRRR